MELQSPERSGIILVCDACGAMMTSAGPRGASTINVAFLCDELFAEREVVCRRALDAAWAARSRRWLCSRCAAVV